MKSVVNQAGASARRHEPSGFWQARISTPRPSCGTRARFAAIAAGEASVRSRIACQAIAGSEWSSQSMAFTPLCYLFERAGRRFKFMGARRFDSPDVLPHYPMVPHRGGIRMGVDGCNARGGRLSALGFHLEAVALKWLNAREVRT